MLEEIRRLLEDKVVEVVQIEAGPKFVRLEMRKGIRHLVRTFTWNEVKRIGSEAVLWDWLRSVWNEETEATWLPPGAGAKNTGLAIGG